MPPTIHKEDLTIHKEGTLVRILRYDKRPEFIGKEAEIGNYSEKDGTYECWLTEDALEGAYALCTPEEIDAIEPEVPVEAEVPKNVTAPCDSMFGVGDRVRGKETGNLGTVVSIDADGDPKVKIDGDDEAKQRFGKEFEVVEKAKFLAGDRVRGKETGMIGTVICVDEDGDPKIKLDAEAEPQQRFSHQFVIIERPRFVVGDRVRGKETGKEGVVVSLDADGDPKVKLDGDTEALQRFGHEYELVERAAIDESVLQKARSRSRSKSEDKKKDKEKEKDKEKKSKKKKKSSSSSSSISSSKRSSASSRRNKRKSAFGKSMLEKREEEKRRARKWKKQKSTGADAALSLFGLR